MPTVKTMMLSSVAVASALLLAACNTTNPNVQNDIAKNWSAVADKEWQLAMVSDGDHTLRPMSPVLASVNFAAGGKVSGSTGCNRYFGTYKQSGSKLDLSPLGSTRMMCVEDAMAIEDAFTNAMAKVTHWHKDNSTLVLDDTDGKAILKFEPIRP